MVMIAELLTSLISVIWLSESARTCMVWFPATVNVTLMLRTMLSPGARLATTPRGVTVLAVDGSVTVIVLLNCVVALAPVFVTVTENVPCTGVLPAPSVNGVGLTSVRLVTSRSGKPGVGVSVGGCGEVVSVLVGTKVGVMTTRWVGVGGIGGIPMFW